ncbi:hypothetical protein AAE478_008422 [Parahypoxylon ruwenzoriense]
MTSKKDMRRLDLVVPYQEPGPKGGETAAELSSTLSSTLPMAAIFTRNRYIGWASVVLSIQSWLGESEDAARSSSAGTPGYFTVGMSLMALAVTYLPMFLPPPPNQRGAGTPAPTGA